MTKTISKTGRPTIMTPEVLEKLRYAFMTGTTNAEACAYAEISQRTLYDYFKKDENFLHKVEEWKLDPFLRAKVKVSKGIDKDVKVAQWYLERRAKKDYGTNVDVTTDGKALPQPILDINAILQDNSNKKDSITD